MKPIPVALGCLLALYGGLYFNDHYEIKNPIKEQTTVKPEIRIVEEHHYESIPEKVEFNPYTELNEDGWWVIEDTPNPEYIGYQEEIEEDTVYYDVPLADEYQKYIIEWCAERDFDAKFVLSVIRCESNYDIYCNYKDTDFGLMQINIGTFEDYGITMETVYDPYVNLECGMSSLYRHFKAVDGDLHKTLIRYNCGSNGAEKLFNKGIYETKYSKKVLTKYKEIKTR